MLEAEFLAAKNQENLEDQEGQESIPELRPAALLAKQGADILVEAEMGSATVMVSARSLRH